jgi:hypothetical protein
MSQNTDKTPFDLKKDRNPWDRLERETDAHYKMFESYLYLPKRTMVEAYCAYSAKRGKEMEPKLVKIPGSWSKIAKDNCWRERARAYDENLSAKRQIGFEQYLDGKRSSLEEYRNNRLQNAKLLQESARDLLAFARERLEHARTVEKSVFKPDGNLLESIDPLAISKLLNLYGLTQIAAGFNAATQAIKQATEEFAHCESVAQTQWALQELVDKLSNGNDKKSVEE